MKQIIYMHGIQSSLTMSCSGGGVFSCFLLPNLGFDRITVFVLLP